MNNIFQKRNTMLTFRKKEIGNSETIRSNLISIKKSILEKTLSILEKMFFYLNNLKKKQQIYLILKNNQFYNIRNCLDTSYIIVWLKRLIYSDEPLILFTNFPNIISIITIEIFENIKKNIIYLYKIILIFTLPVILYRMQKKIFLQTYKNSLNYITYQKENHNKNNILILNKDLKRKKYFKILEKLQNKTNHLIFISQKNKKKQLIKKRDENRFVDMLTTTNLNSKNKIYNTKSNSFIKNEWNYINNLFNDFSNLENNVVLRKENENLNKLFLDKKCKTNVTNKINKYYIFLTKKNNKKIFNYNNLNNLIINKQKEEEKKNLTNNFTWLTNKNFYKKISKRLYKVKLILSQYTNNPKLSSYIEFNINKNTKNIISLLDCNKKTWRYKIHKLTLNNYNLLFKIKNENNVKNRSQKFSMNQKIQTILNPYWKYYIKYFLKPIIRRLKIINTNIYTKKNSLIFSKNYIDQLKINTPRKYNIYKLENNSNYLRSLTLENNQNLQIKHIIEKVNFFPIENLNKTVFDEKEINNDYLNKIYFIQEIEGLLFLKEEDNLRKSQKDLFSNKIWKILNLINKINLKKDFSKFLNKDSKLIYQNILKRNNKLLLDNKNDLLNIKNMIITRKYNNVLNLNHHKIYLVNQIKNKKNNSKNLGNIYKNLNDAIFLIPPSILHKYEDTKNIYSFINTKKSLEIDLHQNDDNYQTTLTVFANLQNIINKNLRNKNYITQIIKLNILQKYIQWIFTSQWWLFLNKIIVNKIPQIAKNILYTHTHNIHLTKINSFLSIHNNELESIIPFSLNESIIKELNKHNKIVLEEIYKSSKKDISIWDTNYKNRTININQWAYIGWIVTICILYYHWSSIFTGTPYIYIWHKFEKMRCLANPSSNDILNILVHNSIQSSSQQLRLNMYSSTGWIVWLKSKIFVYLIQQKFFSSLLFNRNCVDIPRKKKI